MTETGSRRAGGKWQSGERKRRRERAKRAGGAEEHKGCQVSGFGSVCVHSSPLYLG